MLTSSILLASAIAGSINASPLRRRQDLPDDISVAAASYDGQCFYPRPDGDDFDLESYVGRWYQVAGTPAPFTNNCKCVFAEYSRNDDGSVRVVNSCERDGQEVTIEGTANAVSDNLSYGDDGVFRVQFPGQPEPECPGPNYIVQDIEQNDNDNDGDEDEEDDEEDGEENADSNNGEFAIVQSSNFTTMFLLSRQQNPADDQVQRWINRAARLGTNADEVVRFDQSNCQFTG